MNLAPINAPKLVKALASYQVSLFASEQLGMTAVPEIFVTSLWPSVLPRKQYVTASSLGKPIAAEVADSLRVRDLVRSFKVTATAPIVRFLRSRRRLVLSLEEARIAVPLYFRDSQLLLDLVYDRDEDWERLYLIVKSKLSIDELLKTSEKFHDEWVIPRIDTFGGEFTITEEIA
jgi:hypothetical protein